MGKIVDLSGREINAEDAPKKGVEKKNFPIAVDVVVRKLNTLKLPNFSTPTVPAVIGEFDVDIITAVVDDETVKPYIGKYTVNLPIEIGVGVVDKEYYVAVASDAGHYIDQFMGGGGAFDQLLAGAYPDTDVYAVHGMDEKEFKEHELLTGVLAGLGTVHGMVLDVILDQLTISKGVIFTTMVDSEYYDEYTTFLTRSAGSSDYPNYRGADIGVVGKSSLIVAKMRRVKEAFEVFRSLNGLFYTDKAERDELDAEIKKAMAAEVKEDEV